MKKLFLGAVALLGLASTSAMAAITVDTTSILADVTSVGGDALVIVLAVAAVAIGVGLVKKLIRA